MTYVKKPSISNVNFGKYHVAKVDKLEAILNSGIDIYQMSCKQRGSTVRDEYRKVAGVAYMDPKDMVKLSVTNWDNVLVKSDWGEVVVYAAHSRDAPHEGMIFIPKGPWVNVIVDNETYCSGNPTYKGIEVTVEKTDKEALLMADLMKEVYQKF